MDELVELVELLDEVIVMHEEVVIADERGWPSSQDARHAAQLRQQLIDELRRRLG